MICMNKEKGTDRKIKWLANFAVLAFLIFCIFWYGNQKIETGKVYKECFYYTSAESTTDMLDENSEITQEFMVRDKAVNGIVLICATYTTKIKNGTIYASVFDKKGCCVAEAKISAKKMQDNESLIIDFGEQLIQPQEEKYCLKLTFSGIKNEKMSFWIAKRSVSEAEKLHVNGQDVNAHLVLTTIIPGHDLFYKVFIIVMLIISVMIILVYFLLYRFHTKLHYIYFLTGTVLGIVYMIIIPVFAAPDEPTHFYMSYEISNSILGIKEDENRIAMRKDDSENEYITIGIDRKYYNQYYEKLTSLFANNEEIVQTKNWHLKTNKYFYYISAFGIAVGRLLHLSTGVVFLCGRIFNMMLFVLAVTYAIKKIPFGKAVIFLWAILPMTLQQICSYSYDVCILTLSILIISLSLHIAYAEQKEIKRREWLFLYLFIMLLVPAKRFALIPLCFIPVIIYLKKRREFPKAGYYLAGVLIGITFIVVCQELSSLGASGSNATSEHYISWANEKGYTLSELLKTPTVLFEIIGNTIYSKGDYYIGSVLGDYLGWSEISVPMFLLFPYIVLLSMASMKKENEPVYLSRRVKVYFCLIAILGIGFVFAGMLLYWTPVSYDVIMGVQGRYFLPFVPLLFLIMRNNNMIVAESVERGLVFLGIFLQMMIVLCIFLRAA